MKQEFSQYSSDEGRKHLSRMGCTGILFVISGAVLAQAFMNETPVDSRLLVSSVILFFPSFLLYLKAAKDYLPYEREYPLIYAYKDPHPKSKQIE